MNVFQNMHWFYDSSFLLLGTLFLYVVKKQTDMINDIDPKEGNGKPQPATNDPEEAIDTPEKVEESNDEKIDQDFPGYPHYPAKDDILNPENNTERVDLDVENLSRSNISHEHILMQYLVLLKLNQISPG